MGTRRPSSSGDASRALPADAEETGRRERARERTDRGRESETIERTLELVGDRWTILVLRASFRGIRRFDDFCADLGIPRAILTDRLKRLVGAGLLTKEPYRSHPPRFDYRLTPAGVALSPAIVALVRWGDEHLATEPRTTKLVHGPCGTELEQGFWCTTCATTFGPAAIRGVPARVVDEGTRARRGRGVDEDVDQGVDEQRRGRGVTTRDRRAARDRASPPRPSTA